jgi:hypothetical protein
MIPGVMPGPGDDPGVMPAPGDDPGVMPAPGDDPGRGARVAAMMRAWCPGCGDDAGAWMGR